MKQFLIAGTLILFAAVTPVVTPVVARADSSQGTASTATTKSTAALPANVRALLPPGAISLRLGQLPIGPKGAPMLFHIWVMARTPKEGNAGYSKWLASPFCVDLFKAGPQPKTWEYTNSALYLDENEPSDIKARWLQPKKKQGPVLVIASPAFTDVKYNVIAFPDGAEGAGSYKAVQDFYAGGVGGGRRTQEFDIDSRGYMTVVSESWGNGKKYSSTVNSWNGRGFVAGPTKQYHPK